MGCRHCPDYVPGISQPPSTHSLTACDNASQSFFLASTLDHRAARLLVAQRLVGDVPELRVPARMPGSFQGLGTGLQAEPPPFQQHRHRRRRHRVPGRGQLTSQIPGRLDRPPQRRLRIPARPRLRQPQHQPSSASAIRLRRAPGRRTRPSASPPASSSNAPASPSTWLSPPPQRGERRTATPGLAPCAAPRARRTCRGSAECPHSRSLKFPT